MIIALIVGAAVGMQTYVKRSLQRQIKFAVDKLKSDKKDAIGQYEPYYLQSSYDVTTNAYKDTEQLKANGEVERKIGADGDKTTIRSGKQVILDVSKKGDDKGGTE